MIDSKKVHEAMMAAPHDGEPYRQARAAIKAVLEELHAQDPDRRVVRAALSAEGLK